ncbi:MAG: DMT family transporter [Rhodobacteraceae bacterium]|nr:DMT family transporter [Paracoccaceae bacterium]
MSSANPQAGIMLMVVATFVFAVQDGISSHLGASYNVFMVVMLRYWFLGAFVIALALSHQGGLRQVAATPQPWLQILRGLLLAVEICVMVSAFTLLGLVESHAVFVSFPLIIAVLSGPLLGERVGWRRWIAIAIGFAGVLMILQPGAAMFQPTAAVPLLSAFLFALYAVLNRYAARRDAALTSFFYMGVVGMLFMTPIGLWHWQAMAGSDWAWMGLLCLLGATGHWFFIKAFALAEASALQPFAYLQMPFAVVIGLAVFGESLQSHVAIGSLLVIGAGLFTLWRTRIRQKG